MNTQFSQYVNESRAAQHEQDLRREAAAERALRTVREAAEKEGTVVARRSDRPHLGHLFGGLRHRRLVHAGR